ncbi:unnamed protein product [Adineta ricciae]|uniref:Transposase domain-containing protein n=1 Tax=Adineta ricciae TaxID=249248 RepID=A0A815S1F6_ADIRI|nr:unnamed protein product [Adineta ricciae]
MLRFKAAASKKVKARRAQRHLHREIIDQLFRSVDISSSDDNESDHNETDEGKTESLSASLPLGVSAEKSINYKIDQFDDAQLPNEEPIEIDNSDWLFDGSRITAKDAVRRLTSFMIDFNRNKRTVIGLLRIIKGLLPTPNRLPTTWKGILKALGHVSTSHSSYLCANCLKHCRKNLHGVKSCVDEECIKRNRMLKSNEIVELTHLDIRSQIQAILTRNQPLLNRCDLYPATDVCFADHYRNQSDSMSNRVTLIVHTDGAPVVKSSKQSLWPCFASLVELPPPVRDYQKNIILMSLWTSKKKPDANVFLEETIEELKHLINRGTSIFINGYEYQITLQTQYFVSDLPAKALFCRTINFNGYSACTECCSKGEWSGLYKVVVYPFTRNNLTPRTHAEYLDAAKEAQKKSAHGKAVSIRGIKGLSTLLEVFEYPSQITFDYMHLICLGHIPSLIKRWCQRVDKSALHAIDVSLDQLLLPHNLSIPFLESIEHAEQWKAKNSRLFVLNVGVPVVTLHLPRLLASHYLLYSLSIIMLHAPKSNDETNLAEDIINYYCKTSTLVHDPSIELFSLHAHIHLAQQVRRHGGLGHTSAFGFESCIRFIQKKAHGSKNLGSQISYWIDLQSTVQAKTKVPTLSVVNEIRLDDRRLTTYRPILLEQFETNGIDLNSCTFHLRLKNFFVTYHTTIYDQPFKCRSFIVSFSDPVHKLLRYGNIIVFVRTNEQFYALIQRYRLSEKCITNYVDIPCSLHLKANELFPLVEPSDELILIPITEIRHKCVKVPFDNVFCLSEIRLDYEHD